MMKVTQSNFREKIVWLIDYQSQGSSSLMLCSSCITVCKKAIHVHACTLYSIWNSSGQNVVIQILQKSFAFTSL